MDAKLERFLKQIELEDIYIEKLKDAKIVSVIYKKNEKRFLVRINIDNILDPNIVNTIERKIKEKNLQYDVVYEVNNSSSINNLAINSYYLTFIMKNFKGAPAFDGLKKIKLNLVDNYSKIVLSKIIWQEQTVLSTNFHYKMVLTVHLHKVYKNSN